MNNIDLRTYNFIDNLQLQMASFMCTISRGYFPVGGQACAFIEISPGIQIVERSFGLLEVHSDSQADVRQAGASVLEALDLSESDRMKPGILTSQLIKNVSDHHAQLINKVRFGNMVLRGDTLFVLEIEPAGYAFYAANEAEKASNIKIINVTGYGKYGRVYISGPESEVLVSKETVESKLADINGRS